MKTISSTRRSFVRSLAASAGALPLAGCFAPSINKRRSPNQMLSHAAIGTGRMAWSDLMGLSEHPEIHITALCDVDSSFLERAKAKFPDARIYRDAFEMFAEEGDRIDSVNVSTPDHTHAQYVIEALRRGLNVYSEKPLCTKMEDSREIQRLAAERRVVTQLGTQIAAWECDRRTVACIKEKPVGDVKHIWLFSTRRREPTSGYFQWPIKEDPVPPTLDWKLWLGPAPYRPYSAKVYHPGAWRRWRDFGSSWLGDLGIHLMSPVWLGLGLGEVGAESVVAEVAELNWTEEQRRQFWPSMSHVTWKFPGIKASGMKPFEIEWFDGYEEAQYRLEPKFFPPAFLQDIAALTPLGALPSQGRVIECTDGWIFSTHYNVDPFIVDRKGLRSPLELPGGGAAPSHYAEFIEACLRGGTTTSPFSVSAKMSEWCMTGNFAQLTPGKRLTIS